MDTHRMPFSEAHEHFRKKKWKLLIPYQHYRIFIKPGDSNEPPRWVYLDDDGYVDRNEFNAVKP